MPKNGFLSNREKAEKIIRGKIGNPQVKYLWIDAEGLVHFLDDTHVNEIDAGKTAIKRKDLVDIRSNIDKCIGMVEESIRMGWQIH